MQCTAICNLTEYPVKSHDVRKQLKRTFRNNIELADILISDTFDVIYEDESCMIVRGIYHGKELYLVDSAEKQCFEFE